MDNLLNFIDFSCIDPQLYWRVPSRDGLYIFEIQWRRDDQVHWRFRRLGAALWELSSNATLFAQLNHLDIDTYLFEIKLKNSILQQVTYAHRIVNDAKKIFGAEEIERAFAEHQSFMAQLENAIMQIVQTSKSLPPPNLRLLKN